MLLHLLEAFGENGPEARKRICDYLEVFGIKLDDEKNNVRGKVWIIPTNEEIMIARDAKEIITK